jgi:putative NADH-flavin reductase
MLEYAAREGHGLRALVRDPARLPAGLGGHIIAGDVSDPDAVRATIDGCEAVLSALGGAGLANPGTAISGGMKTIVAEMKRAGISRVLAVGGSGVLDGADGKLRSEAPDFPKVFAAISQEHRTTWEVLKPSGLDWTMVCCPDILDGELTKRYRVSADVLPDGGRSISTEDVAWFMLQQVPLTPFVRRRVGIAY